MGLVLLIANIATAIFLIIALPRIRYPNERLHETYWRVTLGEEKWAQWKYDTDPEFKEFIHSIRDSIKERTKT